MVMYLLIGIPVVSILIVGIIWIVQGYILFEKDSALIRGQFLENQKNWLKGEADKVSDYMDYMHAQTEDRLKQTIKDRVYEAIEIASNLYTKYKNSLPLASIRKMVIESLRPIRFNFKRGYYFATNLDGIEQLFADRPELEKQNLLDMIDKQGNYVIRDMIKIAKENQEGFYRYYWTMPGKEGDYHSKIAFIKYFKPFNWFIGTGEYLEDVEEDIKKEVLARIQSIRYGKNGYIFAISYEGKILAHLNTKLIGKNLNELLDEPDSKKIMEAVQKVIKTESCFLEYMTGYNRPEGKVASKLSYMKSIPEWKWVIGAGEYLDEFEMILQDKRTSLNRQIRSLIIMTVFFLIILVSIILTGAWYIGRRVNAGIKTFISFFDQAAFKSTKIDMEQLDWDEFKQLASAANHMVDERTRVEKDLKKSSENFAKSQAISHLGSWEWDLATNEMYWSDELYRLLGEDIRHKDIFFNSYIARIYPKDLGRVNKELQECLEDKKTYNIEHRIVKPDGTVRVHHTQAEVVKDETGKPGKLVGIEWDITEIKLAEERTALLTRAVEQADEIILITDPEGRIQYVNPAFEQISGYSQSDVIGKTPSILNSGKLPKVFFKDLWATISAGKVWRGRIINKKKDGSLFLEDATISPIRNASGIISNYVAVKQDVTHEVEMEKQLQQAHKMEAIGTLAGGIAHDFNNILGAIIGYSELVLYDLESDSITAENIRQVLIAGHRAKDLVKQILSFSRIGDDKKIPIQLSIVVKEAVKLLRASLPSFLEIQQEILSATDYIMGEPTRLQQLILNLCTNAAHAMEENEKGGVLKIKLDTILINESNSQEFVPLKHGCHIRLSISDNGIGIPSDLLDRIFEPYFTTKEHGKGTGFGLALVHNIVMGHSGSIKVWSEVGKGSTFTVYFPVIENPSASLKDESEVLPVAKENESILLVDDEITLTNVGQQMLEKLGYRVTPVNEPLNALKLFMENPNKFDLVITDMTMPKMTGDKLALEIKLIRRDIPIIL